MSNDTELRGTGLAREYFKRAGEPILCFVDDESDAQAVSDGFRRFIGECDEDGDFIADTGSYWEHAVPCTQDGRVLTATELLNLHTTNQGDSHG